MVQPVSFGQVYVVKAKTSRAAEKAGETLKRSLPDDAVAVRFDIPWRRQIILTGIEKQLYRLLQLAVGDYHAKASILNLIRRNANQIVTVNANRLGQLTQWKYHYQGVNITGSANSLTHEQIQELEKRSFSVHSLF